MIIYNNVKTRNTYVAITWYLPVSCSLTISSETPHSTRNIVSENLSNNPVDGWMLKFTLAFLEPGLSIAWLMIQRYGYLIRLFERTKKEKKKEQQRKKRFMVFYIEQANNWYVLYRTFSSHSHVFKCCKTS